MKTIHRVLNQFLCLFIVLQCYTLLDVFYDQTFIAIIDILMVSCLLFSSNKGIIIISVKRRIKYIFIGYGISMALLIGFGGFRNLTFINSVVFMFFLFIIYFSNKDNVLLTFKNLSNIVLIISVISLFFFIFATCTGLIKPTAYYSRTVVKWGTFNYYDYYHLYCTSQLVKSLGYTGYRNMAFFLEGPMFAYVLAIALFCELFLREKHQRKIVIVIECLAMLTCFSTTGFLVVIVLFGARFFNKLSRGQFIKRFFIPIVLLAAFYCTYVVVVDKIIYGFASYALRFDDIRACILCFIKNPILGVGYENMRGIDPYRAITRKDAGMSTGVGAVLATGGSLLSIWYILPTIFSMRNFMNSSARKKEMLFVLVMFFLLANTIVQSKIMGTFASAISWIMIIKEDEYEIA